MAKKILDLIYHCNPGERRLDFELASRAYEFGFTTAKEFQTALESNRGSFASLSFDNGFAVCIAPKR